MFLFNLNGFLNYFAVWMIFDGIFDVRYFVDFVCTHLSMFCDKANAECLSTMLYYTVLHAAHFSQRASRKTNFNFHLCAHSHIIRNRFEYKCAYNWLLYRFDSLCLAAPKHKSFKLTNTLNYESDIYMRTTRI